MTISEQSNTIKLRFYYFGNGNYLVDIMLVSSKNKICQRRIEIYLLPNGFYL